MYDINEIKAGLDVLEVIGAKVELRRSGASYSACCPFHDERTPSFHVFPTTQTWKCFGACGLGGDAIDFIQAFDNLSTGDAIRAAAEMAGIRVQEESHAWMYEINREAAEFFKTKLHHGQEADEARKHLAGRGINSDVARHFGLGFAPAGWTSLFDRLTASGWSAGQIVAAGLAKVNEKRNSHYDVFRSRVMIPILDRNKRVLGFTGRSLGDEKPKYLNTTETTVFRKSQIVFPIDKAAAAIRETGVAVIVEGHMDAVAAHQHGFINVVAVGGTALSANQFAPLAGAKIIIFAMDSDLAGRQATIRAINKAIETINADLYIVQMPEGLDPDDVIRAGNWEKCLEEKKLVAEFYLEHLMTQYDKDTPAGKKEIVREMQPIIAGISDPIERSHYIKVISRALSVSEASIEQGIERREEIRVEEQSADLVGQDYLIAWLLSGWETWFWIGKATGQLDIDPISETDFTKYNQDIYNAAKAVVMGPDDYSIDAVVRELQDNDAISHLVKVTGQKTISNIDAVGLLIQLRIEKLKLTPTMLALRESRKLSVATGSINLLKFAA